MPRKILRRALLGKVAVGCVLTTTFAHDAQSQSQPQPQPLSQSPAQSQQQSQAQQPVAFEIRPQPLAAALREYARICGQQIIFTHEIVAGRDAPALHGVYTPDSALARLLDGTGLKVERSTSGAIMVKQAALADSAPPADHHSDPDAAERKREAPPVKPFRMAAADTTTPNPAAAGTSSHDPLNGGLEEIIVTAQKRRENINDVGMSVTALSGDQLASTGIRSPEDLAKGVAGLTYSRVPSGPPVFSIRGIGFPEVITAGAPGVSTYVDEVPLPYSLMTIGAALDVQRVEVLKGPQGTLFGQNVTGGAINFIANRPTDALAVGATVSYGSYGRATANGYVSGPLSDTVKARFAAGVDRIDDWQKSYTRNDKRGAGHVYSGRMLVDWEAADKLAVQFNINGWVDKSDEQAGQLIGVSSPFSALAPTARQLPRPTDSRHGDWNPGVPLGAIDPISGAVNDSFSRDNHYFQAAMRADYELGDSTTLTSITAWQKLKQQALADVDGTNVNNWNTGSGADIEVFSQELRLAGRTGRLGWLLGANYAKDDIYNYASVFSDVGFFPFDATGSIGNGSIDTYAAFAHLEFGLTDALRAVAGVRYTNVSIHNESCTYDGGDGLYARLVTGIAASRGVFITVPRGGCVTLNPVTFQPGVVVNDLDQSNVPFTVGLNWKVTPDALLYGSVSRGYKTGGFTLSGATFAPGFDPATQESVLAYETGFKLGLIGHRLQMNGAVYYYDYTDKQVRGSYNDPVAGTLNRLINIPTSTIKGAELQLAWVPDDHWRASLGAAYTDSKIGGNFTNLNALGQMQNLHGTVLPFTPLWQLVGDVEYSFPISSALGAFIGTHAHYQGDSYAGLGENTILRSDAYTVLDLRLGIRSQDNLWSLTAYADNATDKYYWRAATLAGTDAITRTANLPRIFGLRFSIRH